MEFGEVIFGGGGGKRVSESQLCWVQQSAESAVLL